MTIAPYGITVFCDDIRYEVNGKTTLVGCYSSEMNFNGPSPGVLPIFAAWVNVNIPTGNIFSNVTVKIIKIDEEGTNEIFLANVEIPEKTFEEGGKPDDFTFAVGLEKILSLSLPVQWSPMTFSGPCLIRVLAKLDDGEEFRAGSLKVNFLTSEVLPESGT